MKELFSAREQKILAIIGKKKVTIAHITMKLFGKDQVPWMANNVAGAVRRIAMKCQYHDVDWTLEGEGIGRLGRTVWREKK